MLGFLGLELGLLGLGASPNASGQAQWEPMLGPLEAGKG